MNRRELLRSGIGSLAGAAAIAKEAMIAKALALAAKIEQP